MMHIRVSCDITPVTLVTIEGSKFCNGHKKTLLSNHKCVRVENYLQINTFLKEELIVKVNVLMCFLSESEVRIHHLNQSQVESFKVKSCCASLAYKQQIGDRL